MLCLADAAGELAQAEMAVGDQRAHPVQSGECQRLPVVGGPVFGIEPVGMGRDVAEQAQRMGPEARLAPRGFDRTIAQAPRLVEPAEKQTGATHRAVGPAAMADDLRSRLMLEESLALQNPVHRLAGLADFR